MIAHLLLLALAQAAPDADELWLRGERLAAVERMEERLADAPDDAELRVLLVERELAVHRYRAALEHLDGLGPEHDALRGRALYLLGRYAEAVLYLDPRSPDNCLARVDALEALGRGAEADAALEEAADVLGEGHPRILTLRGRRRAAAGDDAAAIERFRRALAADPLELEARFGLGRALVRSGRREEGLAELARHRELVPLVDRLEFALQSLDLAPAHAPNHAQLGEVERELGRLDRARAAFAEAERLAGSDEVTPVALRHARLYAESLGDVDGALAVLERAHGRSPDVRLLVRGGDLLADAGRRADAARWYERALALRPGDAQVRARLDAVRGGGG